MSTTDRTRINLKLRELGQLFNSMDPAPFIDRDLDDDAEEFIVSSAREAHGSRRFELVVHLGSTPDPETAAATERAVRHYFAARAELKRREFRLLLRRGQTVLAVGLVFLTACLFLGNLMTRVAPPHVAGVLREGFMILGWVAMWKPLELFLYDWWPVREEWRGLQRLSELRVHLVLPSGKSAEKTA